MSVDVYLMEENIIQINDGITINVDIKKQHIYEKDYVWNLSTCRCKNGKYLASIMDDSTISSGETNDAEAKS